MSATSSRREAGGFWIDALALMAGRAALSWFALRGGPIVISDDDYARVVIAERWAHAPVLDPSGTSWLPVPFWLNGSAMLVFGRSLAVARGVGFALGVASTAILYVAARWMTGDRRSAWIAVLLSMAFMGGMTRLGLATVPEVPTAALTVLAIASARRDASARQRILGGAALLLATLSRYEAWIAAGAIAALTIADAVRAWGDRRSGPPALAALGLAVMGPLSWIAWNAHAHGDALHFFARVSAYKRALGGAGAASSASVAGYVAGVWAEPLVLGLFLTAALAVCVVGEGAAFFKKHTRSLAIGAAILAGLGIAAMGDGAPTHHPERALLAVLVVLLVVGSDALSTIAKSAASTTRTAAAYTLVCGAACALAVVDPRRVHEDSAVRANEEAIGEAVGGALRPDDRVLLEVVDYGYLAVIAGSGRPERMVPDRDIDPRHAAEPSAFENESALERKMRETKTNVIAARGDAPALTQGAAPEVQRATWAFFRVAKRD